MSKTLKILIFSGAALVILFIAGVMIKAHLDHKRLMAEGTRAEGNVLELFEEKSRRRKGGTSTSYYAKVGLFTKDKAPAAAAPAEPAAAPAPATTPAAPKSAAEAQAERRAALDSKLDKIFDQAKDAGKLGEYNSLTISISRSLFDKLKVGERVKVIYMPGELDLAEILEE